MKRRIFILMHHDLVSYPPMHSLMRFLTEMDYDLYYIGVCTDAQTQKTFEEKGFKFIYLDSRRPKGKLNIVRKQRKAKEGFLKILRTFNISNKDLLWIEYSSFVHAIVKNLQGLRFVAHFYEFVNDQFGWIHKLVYPNFNMHDFLHQAKAVVHCEYNRAIITKGLYDLELMPYVLPNKPYFDESLLENIPSDIADRLDNIKDETKGKKIILYQGVFDSKERRLEEFCQAIELLPDEYVLMVMGAGGVYFQDLKRRYESKRVLFEDFIRPPYHLAVTKMSVLGVLTYNPLNTTMAGVINPLYCAPNKIFEFSRYGIPMISNDVPGLKFIFEGYHCGDIVSYPVTPEKVAEMILLIIDNEENMRIGAQKYYESIDFPSIVRNILKEVY